jgi:hypothetical protein
MVVTYKRKSTRQSWDEEAMRNAIEAVKTSEMGWLKASKTFLVPHATLRRRAQNRNNKAKDTSKGLGRYSTTFDEESENELVNHILSLE